MSEEPTGYEIVAEEIKKLQAENVRLREALEEAVFVTADVSDMLRKYDGLDEWSTPVINIDRLWATAKQALAKGGECEK